MKVTGCLSNILPAIVCLLLAAPAAHGPEFTSGDFSAWCKSSGIELRYIQPGKPTQNAYIERFNGTYRSEVLDAYLFESLSQAQQLTEEWMKHYNEARPHEGLGNKTPAEMRQLCLQEYTLQRD